MPAQIVNRGKNNEIEVSPRVMLEENFNITILGDNNKIVINESSKLNHARIRLGQSCNVSIDGASVSALIIFCNDRGVITIGKGCSFTAKTRLLAHEAGTIRIGEDCLFASDTLVTISDMHSILDIDTGLRVNPAKDIFIESHVWVGLGATILKGVTIGEGSVIGAGSHVTRDIPKNSLAVGAPARVVRERVTWRRELI